MRSIWSLYKAARDNDDDNTLIATNVTAIASSTIRANSLAVKVDSHAVQIGSHAIRMGSQDTRIGSYGGTLAGSSTMRVTNVETVPGVVPAAGTMYWDSTLKIALFSDGTSFFTLQDNATRTRQRND